LPPLWPRPVWPPGFEPSPETIPQNPPEEWPEDVPWPIDWQPADGNPEDWSPPTSEDYPPGSPDEDQGPAPFTFSQKPQVLNPTATSSTECDVSSSSVTFQWTFFDQDGDSQQQYHIQIDKLFDSDSCNFDNPDFDIEETGGSTEYALQGLEFNTYYCWRIRVSDGTNYSDWVRGRPFKTPLRPPEPNFSWTPQNPEVDKKVSFTNKSVCYDPKGCSYEWNFGDGITSSEENPPSHSYSNPDSYTVTLTVTNKSDNQSCTIEHSITVGEEPSLEESPLPSWREIPPF